MTAESAGLLHMLNDAGPVVKFIMLLLLFFSIISWAIVFIKFRYLRHAFRESADFTEVFWQCRTLADAFTKAKALRSSPVARIFITSYMEMARSDTKEGKMGMAKETNLFPGHGQCQADFEPVY